MSKPLALGAMHYNSNLYEIQRTNHFQVIFPADSFGEEFTLLVESFRIPEVSVGKIQLDYGNSDVKVAGKPETGPTDLVIRDAIGQRIERKIDAWCRKVYDPETEKIGWVEDYKKTLFVDQYGPDGTVVRTWKCIGCWPASRTTNEFNYNSSDKKLITINISVDKAFPVIED